jgi:nucleotide-binding universal stress UspA family protein
MHIIPDLELKEHIQTIVKKSVLESLNVIKEMLESNDIEVYETIIKCGNIVEAIVQKANSQEVNLVLLGENIDNRGSKFKLSVKSEQIISASDIPVYLISQIPKPELTHILCPVDFSEPSRRALYNAVSMARKFNARLIILNVYETISYVSSRIQINLEEENALRLKNAQNDMKTFIEELDLKDVNYNVVVKSGKAYENILSMIEDEQIDLLIMGTNGRTGLNRFIMGNITEKVIREMPCSFMTLKKINAIGTNKVTYV